MHVLQSPRCAMHFAARLEPHGAVFLESRQRTPRLDLSRVLAQPADPTDAIRQRDIRRFPPRGPVKEYFGGQRLLTAVAEG